MEGEQRSIEMVHLTETADEIEEVSMSTTEVVDVSQPEREIIEAVEDVSQPEREIIEAVEDVSQPEREIIEVVEEVSGEFFTPCSYREQDQDQDPTVEELFRDIEVPSWRKQVTLRCLLGSFILSALFSFIALRLVLSSGMASSLNVPAGLLGYAFVKLCTMTCDKFGIPYHPFTRQENAVMQTCIITASSIAISGGLGSHLLAMGKSVAKQVGEDITKRDLNNLTIMEMVTFLYISCLPVLPVVLLLRKLMILKYKLEYPIGTTDASLINTFHSPSGAKLARKQVLKLGKFFTISFIWASIKWVFAAGKQCGFAYLPIFGLKAYKHKFYLDFSLTYVGVGMISPHMTNVSLLLGSLLSWGFFWPRIAAKKGHWYDKDLKETSFHGLQGYKVFIAAAIILGDGLFQFLVVLCRMAKDFYSKYRKRAGSGILPSARPSGLTYDDERRIQLFIEDPIPMWVAIMLYITFAAVSSFALQFTFLRIQCYYLLFLYLIALPISFCNSYGSGITDWSLAATYGRLVVFIIAAWAGGLGGGVILGLGACAIVTSTISSAADLMQDHKTGYLTLASPKAMAIGQFIEILMGCVMSPSIFWIFSLSSPDIGAADSSYPAPNALVFRNMAIIGVQGFKALPANCLTLCYVAFSAAVAISAIREFGKQKKKIWAEYIPIPMVMAIPFYIGGYFAIDVCIGSLIMFVWRRRDEASAKKYSSAIASGLICGEGIWTLPSSILSVFGIHAPMCMRVISRKTDAKLATLLGG